MIDYICETKTEIIDIMLSGTIENEKSHCYRIMLHRLEFQILNKTNNPLFQISLGNLMNRAVLGDLRHFLNSNRRPEDISLYKGLTNWETICRLSVSDVNIG